MVNKAYQHTKDGADPAADKMRNSRIIYEGLHYELPNCKPIDVMKHKLRKHVSLYVNNTVSKHGVYAAKPLYISFSNLS